MVWQRREKSEADLYHVTIRGTGRQLIFEDDNDRLWFLARLRNLLDGENAQVLAWCLMGNHAHMLLHVKFERLPIVMRRLCQSYAVRFNKIHDRVGHLMQGRYGSVAIENDAQLLATVRYIHNNPQKAGISSPAQYEWCSYADYANGHGAGVTDTDMVLGMLGGIGLFIKFHESEQSLVGSGALSRQSERGPRISDSTAQRILNRLLSEANLVDIPMGDKSARNAVLAELKQRGLSVRQIERLTGIGRNIIDRAK